jgi:antitoxin (DNA-binding transcriptional repressor) of toxin-antitoxin stability system
MRQVNMHEAKTHLSRLVEEAAAGEAFVNCKAGRPMVRVTPLDNASCPTPQRRRLGLLLDTHLLVWAMGSPDRLPTGLAAMLEDPGNTPVFSVASISELVIKQALGGLTSPCSSQCCAGPSCRPCTAIPSTGCCWPRPRPTGCCY